jgi:peptidoglycan/xylan/chitin deacetylase (PgdA/CDA1 family)
MKNTIVTTSWDDGHILDKKLALLLQKYNLKGTFYISPKNSEFKKDDLLDNSEILALSKNFEIGAHTMTHPRLPYITKEEAKKEIEDSKVFLENIIGRPVTSFCYPRGEYLPFHKEMVKDAGFSLARTVRRFITDTAFDPYELHTTIHAYRHYSDITKIAKHTRYNPITFLDYYLNWDRFAISLFEKTKREGGVFHLWGHSWEIEKFGTWASLERVFAHISNKEMVEYVPNSELV